MIYGQALEAPNDSKFCVSRTIPRRHESTASGRCAKQNGLMKKSMQQSLGELGRLGVRETKSDDKARVTSKGLNKPHREVKSVRL